MRSFALVLFLVISLVAVSEARTYEDSESTSSATIPKSRAPSLRGANSSPAAKPIRASKINQERAARHQAAVHASIHAIRSSAAPSARAKTTVSATKTPSFAATGPAATGPLAKAQRIKSQKAAASGGAASRDTLENYNRFKSYGDAAAKPPQYAKDSHVHKRMPDSEYLDNSQLKLQKIRKGTVDKPENMVRAGWKAKMAAKGTAKAGRVRKASGVLGGAAVAAGATDAEA